MTPKLVATPPPDGFAGADTSWETTAPAAVPNADRAIPYVARILQQHLIDDPATRYWTCEGTTALLDISGFTKLSEKLARKGREGAEQITEAIARSFEAILQAAYDNGGSLLKFGGDALLLWFQGDAHVTRACRTTVRMRRVLRDVGRIEVPGAKITLRISQGVHSGTFHFFAAGSSHYELLPTSAAWSRAVAMEHAASAGEIVVSPESAALLPGRCTGKPKAPGVLLLREPPGHAEKLPLIPRPKMAPEMVLRCLSPEIRAHVQGGGGSSEHRPVTIAFIRFEGTDAMIEQRGPTAVAEALHRLASVVEAATEEQDVTFLGSDVDADGGKLILTAGAPKVTGDDEEHMLLALRKIVEADVGIPIRIGVHRGSVFAGDIGPFFRRTYTVMGDAVNLSARLMAGAKPGLIYATADVLDRSNTLFETTELPPFAVKGKAKPVQAWSVGRAKGSRTRTIALQRLPMIGRDAELGIVRETIAAAREGKGRLIDVVGEAGVGKTRLLEAMRDEATGFHPQHAVCEAYTASTPYAVWRELLREFMNFGRDDPDALIAERLRDAVAARTPDLVPWLPLIAIPFGVEVPPTPEVELLAEKNRRAKLHEAVGTFLAVSMPEPQLIQIEDAHHMDGASAELLSYLTRELAARPWLVGVARRPAATGFSAPESPTVTRIELTPLAPKDAAKLVQAATEQRPLPLHMIEIIAQRSGGNPQFLRDLVRSAIATGGIGGLPDSAEAAAMARIDALAPEDRAIVRRAAVFGQTFHPQMLTWFAEDGQDTSPGPAAWSRLGDFFDEEPDGYLRFRRSLLRDAAYEGLPYKLRRRLHGVVAARIAREADDVDESAAILSMHYFVAGDYGSAWRFASIAAKRAEGVYAYVEAARLYSRALEAGRHLEAVSAKELATMQESLGDSWNRAGDFPKATEAYTAGRELVVGDPLMESGLLLKRSKLEEKLGKYPQALRWAARARKALDGGTGPEAARQEAQLSAWYATVLQVEGKSRDAVRWARQAIAKAEAAGDSDALGAAYFVLGWAGNDLGTEPMEPLWRRSLEAYERAGNRVKHAGLLANLGAACKWDNRWDDALSYYERAREECLKLGSTVEAAVARMNTAEILAERGELAEAEAILFELLPFWRAVQYRAILGDCLGHFGRVALHAGRFEEALGRFEEAKSHYLHVGARQEVLDVDARIAECLIFQGDPDAALALTDSALERTDAANTKLVALLQRVRGFALYRQGNAIAARKALEASLAAARTRGDSFEIVQTLLALIALDRAQGIEPPPVMLEERRSLVANLKIRSTPPLPIAAG